MTLLAEIRARSGLTQTELAQRAHTSRTRLSAYENERTAPELDTLERIAAAAELLARSIDAVEARIEAEAVEVAVAVGRKLAFEMVSREPMAEIAALATECFKQLVSTPHVVVRVNDELLESAREKLEHTTRAGGFEGRLVVLAEPDIALGDCRIEWADGGIKRDSAATQTVIDEAVARYIAGRRGEPNTSEKAWRPQS